MWHRQNIGHGIGLRTKHYGHILEHGLGPRGARPDWFEVISENFFEPGGRPWRVLEKVRSEAPVVMHGVSLAIGNVEPLSESYLKSLESLARRIEPAWVSDHLCWGGHGGHYAHDLLPLPYTQEALAHVAGRVERVQERLQRQILLENVSSYVAFQESEMPEWEFLVEVARRSGCGILLDVNNIYVSARNHGFRAETYLDAIPGELVGQIHLAGHTDKGTHLLDTHVGPVPAPVWALYERAVARLGEVPSLIEWDEDVPEYETVAAECAIAKNLDKKARRAA